MEDIQYKWASGLNSSALDIAPNIELPQLKYTKYQLIERQFKLSTGLNSRLTLRLYFSRSLGYYITHVPSTLHSAHGSRFGWIALLRLLVSL